MHSKAKTQGRTGLCQLTRREGAERVLLAEGNSMNSGLESIACSRKCKRFTHLLRLMGTVRKERKWWGQRERQLCFYPAPPLVLSLLPHPHPTPWGLWLSHGVLTPSCFKLGTVSLSQHMLSFISRSCHTTNPHCGFPNVSWSSQIWPQISQSFIKQRNSNMKIKQALILVIQPDAQHTDVQASFVRWERGESRYK